MHCDDKLSFQQVTFETDVLVTAFVVRHDVSHGQRLSRFQVVWAEDCASLDNVNNTDRYKIEVRGEESLLSIFAFS